jgi:hypothetical protein
MSRLAVPTFALALAFAAPAFAADPLIAEFQDRCVSTRAVAATVLARAEADGWSPVVTNPVLDRANKLGIIEPIGRTASTPHGEITLIVGDGHFPGDGLNIDMCVITSPAATATLAADLHAWLKVERFDGDADNDMYVFKMAKGTRVAYSKQDMDAARADAAKGLLLFVIRQSNLLLYGVSKPAQPTPDS